MNDARQEDGLLLYKRAFREIFGPNAQIELSPTALDRMLELKASERPSSRIPIPIVVRPMLVQGQLATDAGGPLILINSEEEPPHEQVVTLFHEVLHLLGMTDEFLCDEYAMKLADAAPDILRRLAHNINVPPYDRGEVRTDPERPNEEKA